ncbi:MAG: hypothetical protein C6Y20_14215 [Tagaea sp. CACIAM 22H2]|nr:hypothetical protein [Tagaea sp. CACIAM 22H2]
MTEMEAIPVAGVAGAFGVNYALRPHKFVDRRIFIEVLSRYAICTPIREFAYVGLGSFAMEDHKLMNASFDMMKLISLEIDSDVWARQKFNLPLSCITATSYSTQDFVSKKGVVFKKAGVPADANAIVWFDMTDALTLRASIDTFEGLLRVSEPGDVIRLTIDVDEKTLARSSAEASLDDIRERRFNKLREMLGDQLRPGAKSSDLLQKLGITKLAVHAFNVAAEAAFSNAGKYTFEPLSITTYADGHRMLSVTGAVVKRSEVDLYRKKMDLKTVPGGVGDWQTIVDVEIPQLTVWEKLTLDRDIHSKSAAELAAQLNFKLHESIPTENLIERFKLFQRFYPTFRHVLL